MGLIVMTFNNRFTGDDELKVTMPYDPYKSKDGFYRRKYLTLKKGIAGSMNTPAYLFTSKIDKISGRHRSKILF